MNVGEKERTLDYLRNIDNKRRHQGVLRSTRGTRRD